MRYSEARLCHTCSQALRTGVLELGEQFLETEQLYFELTNRCNLRCKYCYNWSGDPPSRELSFDSVVRLIDILVDRNEAVLISLGGGEPLLREDCLDIAERAVALGAQVKILTNGTTLDRKKVERIVNLGILTQVSINGPPEEADAKIRGPTAFRRTMEAIDLFLASGGEALLSVSVTLHKGNVQGIRETTELMLNRGVKRLGFSDVVRLGRARETWDDIAPTLSDLLEASLEIGRCRKEYADAIDIYTSDWFFATLPYVVRGERPAFPCTREKEIFVSYLGDVRLCGAFDRACYDRGLYFPVGIDDLLSLKKGGTRLVSAKPGLWPGLCHKSSQRRVCKGFTAVS